MDSQNEAWLGNELCSLENSFQKNLDSSKNSKILGRKINSCHTLKFKAINISKPGSISVKKPIAESKITESLNSSPIRNPKKVPRKVERLNKAETNAASSPLYILPIEKDKKFSKTFKEVDEKMEKPKASKLKRVFSEAFATSIAQKNETAFKTIDDRQNVDIKNSKGRFTMCKLKKKKNQNLKSTEIVFKPMGIINKEKTSDIISSDDEDKAAKSKPDKEGTRKLARSKIGLDIFKTIRIPDKKTGTKEEKVIKPKKTASILIQNYIKDKKKKLNIEKITKKIEEELKEKNRINSLENLQRNRKVGKSKKNNKPKHKFLLTEKDKIFQKTKRRKHKKSSQDIKTKLLLTENPASKPRAASKSIRIYEIINAAIKIQRWYRSLLNKNCRKSDTQFQTGENFYLNRFSSSSIEESDSFSTHLIGDNDNWINLLESKFTGANSKFVEEFKSKLLKENYEIDKKLMSSQHHEHSESEKKQSDERSSYTSLSENEYDSSVLNNSDLLHTVAGKTMNEPKRTFKVPLLHLDLIHNESDESEEEEEEELKSDRDAKIDPQSLSDKYIDEVDDSMYDSDSERYDDSGSSEEDFVLKLSQRQKELLELKKAQEFGLRTNSKSFEYEGKHNESIEIPKNKETETESRVECKDQPETIQCKKEIVEDKQKTVHEGCIKSKEESKLQQHVEECPKFEEKQEKIQKERINKKEFEIGIGMPDHSKLEENQKNVEPKISSKERLEESSSIKFDSNFEEKKGKNELKVTDKGEIEVRPIAKVNIKLEEKKEKIEPILVNKNQIEKRPVIKEIPKFEETQEKIEPIFTDKERIEISPFMKETHKFEERQEKIELKNTNKEDFINEQVVEKHYKEEKGKRSSEKSNKMTSKVEEIIERLSDPLANNHKLLELNQKADPLSIKSIKNYETKNESLEIRGPNIKQLREENYSAESQEKNKEKSSKKANTAIKINFIAFLKGKNGESSEESEDEAGISSCYEQNFCEASGRATTEENLDEGKPSYLFQTNSFLENSEEDFGKSDSLSKDSEVLEITNAILLSNKKNPPSPSAEINSPPHFCPSPNLDEENPNLPISPSIVNILIPNAPNNLTQAEITPHLSPDSKNYPATPPPLYTSLPIPAPSHPPLESPDPLSPSPKKSDPLDLLLHRQEHLGTKEVFPDPKPKDKDKHSPRSIPSSSPLLLASPSIASERPPPRSDYCGMSIDELIPSLLGLEISSYLRLVPFKDHDKEVDPSIDFILGYLEVMSRELKENETEVLEAINTPVYQEPLARLAMLQDSSSPTLCKFPTLELILPPELCSELKVVFQSLEIPSRQIYLQMIFDCVNECLNYIRPFGVHGIPDPWSVHPRILFGEAELDSVFSRISSYLIKWASCTAGCYHGPETANDEEKLQAVREEKMSALLCVDVCDEENAWLEYEEEETQMKVLVADEVLEMLTNEIRDILMVNDN